MLKYRLRRAKSTADFDAMKALFAKLFYHWSVPPKWTRPGAQWWVIVDPSKNVVGYCGGYLYAEESSYIFESSGVEYSHQGHGLQRRMIRARKAAAKKLGAKAILTYTYKNPISANNLIRSGFLNYIPENKFGGKDAQYWKFRFPKVT